MRQLVRRSWSECFSARSSMEEGETGIEMVVDGKEGERADEAGISVWASKVKLGNGSGRIGPDLDGLIVGQ